MLSKNNIIASVAAVACIVSFFVFARSFATIKNKEIEMSRHRASLIKDNLELKDRLSAMQELLDKKVEDGELIVKEKKELTERIEALKKENESLIASFQGQLTALKKKNFVLQKKVIALENSPILKLIRDSIEKENDAEIIKVLESAAEKIEKTQSGEGAEIATVDTSDAAHPVFSSPEELKNLRTTPREKETGKKGTVLTVDRQNGLIVISLGSKDDISEGDLLRILRGDAEIIKGEIVSTRSRISAAVVNDPKGPGKITDIKEGDLAVMIEG